MDRYSEALRAYRSDPTPQSFERFRVEKQRAGIDIPHNPEVFPEEERYTGKHIADFAAKLKRPQ